MGTRAVKPWPKDYHTALSELDTKSLLTSTITDERIGEIFKELKERDAKNKAQDREVAKRSLNQRGNSDNPVDMEKFGKKARMSKDGPFEIVRQREQDGPFKIVIKRESHSLHSR